MRLNGRASDFLAVASLILLACVLSFHYWQRQPAWTNDGLFYAAQTLEVRGSSEQAALRAVFRGPPASMLRARERATGSPREQRITDPHWVQYSAKFYRRRWLVPVFAAGLYPLFGLRAVELVSLLGYVLAGVFLFGLLRLRFSVRVAFLVAAVCLTLPSFRTWSFVPLTDSWGVALEAAAIASAVLTLRRGAVFLPAWFLSVGALSLTRDAAFLIVAAAGWLLISHPSTRRTLLVLTGLAAALPTPLLLGAPLKEQLSWAFDGYHIPNSTSWTSLLHQYGPHLSDWVTQDLRVHFVLVFVFLLALFALWIPRGSRDEFLDLVRASALLSIGYLAIVPVYTDFRLELALLPMVAVGMALWATLESSPLRRLVPRGTHGSIRRAGAAEPLAQPDGE